VISTTRRPVGSPLVLDPYADRPLSASDRGDARRGLVGVDCSWNRLGDRGRYPAAISWLPEMPERRRLPWLYAANPQHFGRLGELNTAEAFAAALWVLGEPERARSLLGRFPGGAAFFEVNRSALARYAGCTTELEIREAERRAFSGDPNTE
jgi:pre-rRNA-processing protein TSR3